MLGFTLEKRSAVDTILLIQRTTAY